MTRSTNPLARRQRALKLRKLAESAGRVDAAGELGTLGVALLSAARRQAAEDGVLPIDVDEETFDGLDRGRAAQ